LALILNDAKKFVEVAGMDSYEIWNLPELGWF